MPPTVRDLIDVARVLHWSFTEVELGDGAAVLFLNQRQRTHLAMHGAAIEGVVGTSLQLSMGRTDGGLLVALDDDDVPYTASTAQDGYAVHLDEDGVPYVDTDDPVIAGDPFGANGGTPGVPLPADLVRLINVGAVYGTDGRNVPVDVIPERERYTRAPGRNPTAFVSGNRLVPVLPFATDNSGDRWYDVTAIQFSYVAMQTLTAATDVVALPAVLCGALIADLAVMFAQQSRTCPLADKAGFERNASAAAARIADAADDLLSSVQQATVLYRS